MSKADILAPLLNGEAPSPSAGLFGADFPPSLAEIVVLPVPWDHTASYHRGAALAPQAIEIASHQLDLVDADFGTVIQAGIYMDTLPRPWPWCDTPLPSSVLKASRQINGLVRERSDSWLGEGKIVGVLGGDHSCPLGLMESVAREFGEIGILHIDAHHDLRVAYEGYEFSHASIMHNALRSIEQISGLVSVGIRDFCIEEASYARRDERVTTFYDRQLKDQLLRGRPWFELVQEIIGTLPKQVYISFDIDGLEPTLCPGTGTPVPGGLDFDQVSMLLSQLVESGRRVVGFDLCEVAPREGDLEWNANVGARILYKLCGAVAVSNQLLESS